MKLYHRTYHAELILAERFEDAEGSYLDEPSFANGMVYLRFRVGG